MKKIKFISAIALTLVMASCDDFELPNPPGQTNPEPEQVFKGADFAIGAPASTTIDLVKANAANKDVEVGKITKLENFPSDYELVVDMEVGTEGFAKVATVPTTIEDMTLLVNPDRYNGAIQEILTKKPGEYNTPVRFVAYAVNGNTKLRLGGLDKTYGPADGLTLKVKTLNPAKVIEDAYYLVPCDASGNLNYGKAIRMNNTSGNDVSPYDNPEFAIKIDVTEEQATAGYAWKIAPESAKAAGNNDGVLGCLPAGGEDDALSGKLGADYKVGKIFLQGPVLVTVNIELDSYQVSYALDALYPLSGSTVSNPGKALLLYTDNYINYTGVTTLNSAWTLCGQPDAKGAVVFRQDANLGFEDSNYVKIDDVPQYPLTRTGFLTPKADGAQLVAPVKKLQLYWADVNLIQLTYSITCLETLSVIGDGNDWNLETAVELTPNKDKTVWTGENIKVGTMFKICANHAWDIDFGGAKVEDVTGKQQFNVWMKGGNLEPVPGTYKVTLDFTAVPYTITLE